MVILSKNFWPSKFPQWIAIATTKKARSLNWNLSLNHFTRSGSLSFCSFIRCSISQFVSIQPLRVNFGIVWTFIQSLVCFLPKKYVFEIRCKHFYIVSISIDNIFAAVVTDTRKGWAFCLVKLKLVLYVWLDKFKQHLLFLLLNMFRRECFNAFPFPPLSSLLSV